MNTFHNRFKLAKDVFNYLLSRLEFWERFAATKKQQQQHNQKRYHIINSMIVSNFDSRKESLT